MKTKTLKGYGRYLIQENGLVKNIETGKALKPWFDKDGYARLKLINDKGKRIAFYVSRLVWQAFCGKIPQGFEIDHADANRINNHIDNLVLCTHKQNALLKKQRDSLFLFNRKAPKRKINA